jgi:hypothetical protein
MKVCNLAADYSKDSHAYLISISAQANKVKHVPGAISPK